MANVKKAILVAVGEELPKSTLSGFQMKYTGVEK